MPTLPPHDPPGHEHFEPHAPHRHHPHRAGSESLPTSRGFDPPYLEAPLTGGFSLEVETPGDGLGDKPYPRKRYDFRDRDIKGAVMLVWRWFF